MISLGAIALASLIAACAIDIPKPKAFIRIGTGPQVGVYYATGLALAELVNDGTVRHGVDATAESTEGSVFNINALLKNDLDIAFAQADHEYHAFHGEGDWEGAPHDELRFICGLYTEALALVAEASSGILGLEDVRGKNVSIGAAGSGTRSTALACLDLYDIEPDRDFRTAAFGPGEAGLMLQDGRIDAFFYATGHPNGFLTEATNGTHPVRF
ncbi:MAG: TAXI family TRAP transporter solute-binding subunit, partial [Chlamydiia bacterium]|nr:TAXI family TRAP transporter solute-binding subunit [Chlamydiia bacterium]